ncbi:MAG: hypothetical protein ABIH72_02910 [archaeon]
MRIVPPYMHNQYMESWKQLFRHFKASDMGVREYEKEKKKLESILEDYIISTDSLIEYIFLLKTHCVEESPRALLNHENNHILAALKWASIHGIELDSINYSFYVTGNDMSFANPIRTIGFIGFSNLGDKLGYKKELYLDFLYFVFENSEASKSDERIYG